ncbi:MAG: hypothetical protein Q9192_005060 [Flavoplaca navasiana]
MVKLFLLCSTAVAYYLTWHLFVNNGGADMLNDLKENGSHTLPFNDKAPIRKVYTGNGLIDNQLTILTLFFYNLVDGTHPQACLQAYHFAGQIIPGWSLLMMESVRNGNRRKLISFIVLWGMSMQLATFAVVVPIYLAIHLSTSPTISSRKWSDFHATSSKLHTIPYSVAIGFILPAILLALPAPSVIRYDTKQLYLAVWQIFPMTTGILQIVLPIVRSWLTERVVVEKTAKHTLDHMRYIYATMLVIALVTRISTWTISISALLFPSIFAAEVGNLLKPSSVFLPAVATPSTKMPSIAAAAFQLLQYDEIVGTTAMLLWSTTIYIIAMEQRGPAGWVSLMIKGIVIETLVGPVGFAVAALWARDEIIFANDSNEKKNI